jgi:3-dehydro-L-gulonate 2-dehydrogenase
MRVPFEELKATIKKALLLAGLSEEKAEICAQIHSESSLEGVESHGLNRVPRFIDYVQKGRVDVDAEPTLVTGKAAIENYDGNLGIGITNAIFSMNRAMALADQYGVGVVTLKHTNHWMRGGTYAKMAAEKGYATICWTNAESCMPMWGSDEQGVGNNPICFAVPSEKNEAIFLDMAVSQYSYGRIGTYRLAGQKLPFAGGYDSEGKLTTDPAEIEKTNRALPMGYWKGSGLAIMLDIMAAILSDGNTGMDLDREGQGSGTGCSQIFIVFDPAVVAPLEGIKQKVDQRADEARSSHPIDPEKPVQMPSDKSRKTREENLKLGVHVDDKIWQQVKAIAAGDMDIVDISSR